MVLIYQYNLNNMGVTSIFSQKIDGICAQCTDCITEFVIHCLYRQRSWRLYTFTKRK